MKTIYRVESKLCSIAAPYAAIDGIDLATIIVPSSVIAVDITTRDAYEWDGDYPETHVEQMFTEASYELTIHKRDSCFAVSVNSVVNPSVVPLYRTQWYTLYRAERGDRVDIIQMQDVALNARIAKILPESQRNPITMEAHRIDRPADPSVWVRGSALCSISAASAHNPCQEYGIHLSNNRNTTMDKLLTENCGMTPLACRMLHCALSIYRPIYCEHPEYEIVFHFNRSLSGSKARRMTVKHCKARGRNYKYSLNASVFTCNPDGTIEMEETGFELDSAFTPREGLVVTANLPYSFRSLLKLN